MRLALHACCGPCLLEPFDAYAAEGHQVTVVYANPNIHPVEEYERRLATLRTWAEVQGIDVVELPYDPAVWLERVGPLASDPAARCRACFALRLGMTADWAAATGFDALATTLAVSPYQDAEALSEEGARAAEQAGLAWAGRDFRDRYSAAKQRSRDAGMYRQNYCGCLMSDIEARRSREQRREERRARRTSDVADAAVDRGSEPTPG